VPNAWVTALHGHDRGKRIGALRKSIATANFAARPLDSRAMRAGLRAAVDLFSYQEAPGDEDQVVLTVAGREALRPVADAVVLAIARLPEVGWWNEPADRSDQRYAQFSGCASPESVLTGTPASVAAWVAAVRQQEEAAPDNDADPGVFDPESDWRSAPVGSGCL
jgi:hypothetical protein